MIFFDAFKYNYFLGNWIDLNGTWYIWQGSEKNDPAEFSEESLKWFRIKM